MCIFVRFAKLLTGYVAQRDRRLNEGATFPLECTVVEVAVCCYAQTTWVLFQLHRPQLRLRSEVTSSLHLLCKSLLKACAKRRRRMQLDWNRCLSEHFSQCARLSFKCSSPPPKKKWKKKTLENVLQSFFSNHCSDLHERRHERQQRSRKVPA